MSARAYVVESKEEMTVIVAPGKTSALNHRLREIREGFTVRPASAMDIIDYQKQGGVVEYAEGTQDDDKEETQSETTE